MTTQEAEEAAEKILSDLRAKGLITPEQAQAKRNIDARLAGLGLGPSTGAPTKVLPNMADRRLEEMGAWVSPAAPATEVPLVKQLAAGRLERPDLKTTIGLIARRMNTATEQGAATALLLDGVRKDEATGATPWAHVTPSEDAGLGNATWEPTDLSAATAATSLQTTAKGGTEVKFSKTGIVYFGSGAVGCYWSRALGADQNDKWAPLLPGMRLAYHPQSSLFVGTNTVGGIKVGGALTIAFYELPPNYPRTKRAWQQWHKQIGDWTEGAGSDNALGFVGGLIAGGGVSGTDVTLGTFSDAGAGTQIFKAGTNMPVGGASVNGAAIMNAPNANTDAVWVAETSALAVASNGGIFQSGQDINSVPTGGKLFMLANSGTQKLGVRFRS